MKKAIITSFCLLLFTFGLWGQTKKLNLDKNAFEVTASEYYNMYQKVPVASLSSVEFSFTPKKLNIMSFGLNFTMSGSYGQDDNARLYSGSLLFGSPKSVNIGSVFFEPVIGLGVASWKKMGLKDEKAKVSVFFDFSLKAKYYVTDYGFASFDIRYMHGRDNFATYMLGISVGSRF